MSASRCVAVLLCFSLLTSASWCFSSPRTSHFPFAPFRKKQSVPMAVQIDPDGDVLVNCSGAVTFLVSKKALALASSVLSWMLKAPVEGGLAIKDETSKYAVVSLPHQDPEAFRIFCEAVHHKSTSLSHIPTPGCLRGVAYLVDEYNCGKAMLYPAHVWLTQTVKGRSHEQLWDLLHLAYVANLREHFYDISRELLWTGKGRIRCWQYASEDLRIFSEAILGLFSRDPTISFSRFTNSLAYRWF